MDKRGEHIFKSQRGRKSRQPAQAKWRNLYLSAAGGNETRKRPIAHQNLLKNQVLKVILSGVWGGSINKGAEGAVVK